MCKGAAINAAMCHLHRKFTPKQTRQLTFVLSSWFPLPPFLRTACFKVRSNARVSAVDFAVRLKSRQVLLSPLDANSIPNLFGLPPLAQVDTSKPKRMEKLNAAVLVRMVR
jgi:hypothetical protein